MQDVLKLVMEEARAMWRFRWRALAAAWAFCVLGWLVVLILPDHYEATARVFVDPSTALRPVIQGLAVEQDVNAELNFVRQSLLSDAQLERVMQQTGLGEGVTTPQKKDRAIKDLRDRIEITVMTNVAPGVEPTAASSKIYTISYRDDERNRSLQVVDILLKSFMDRTRTGKQQASAEAQRFLQDQIHDDEQRLAEAEQRLADFKKKNVGLVPGEQQGDYFTRLQNEIDAEKKAQETLNLAISRRDALTRQLHGEAPIAASGGIPATPSQSGAAGAASGGDTLTRINETQAKLDELLLRFTDKHPDVVALRETLSELKARRARELEALRRGDPNAAAVTGASANPVYQQIQLSLNQAEVEIAAARAELNDHHDKVADLRRMVDTMPQVEAEYARLNRDYAVTKEQYTKLVERLEQARLAEEAEATGAVRFEVIDPPTAPFKPVFPPRLLLLGAVLLAGLAAGGALAYLFNLLVPVFSSTRALEQTTGLRVLGAVSLSRSDAEAAQLRNGYLRYSAAAALLAATFVAVVLIGHYFSPLGARLLHG